MDEVIAEINKKEIIREEKFIYPDLLEFPDELIYQKCKEDPFKITFDLERLRQTLYYVFRCIDD